MTPVDVNEPRKTSSFINARMFNHKLDFSATYSNISCFKYTANCMHYLLFCHSRPCKLNWCRHKSIPQLLHFFPPFFLGWKWVGSRLSMHSQNQQERFHMPFGSHILASCHILYDISIFNCAARLREEKREKQRKSGAILARQQWAEASWGSDSFGGVVGYMPLHYNREVYHFLRRNPAGRTMPSEVKNSLKWRSLHFHLVDIGQIFVSILTD